jgi:hypothetical protein
MVREIRELPMCRMALLAAPLVLVGFAAGVVHGVHRNTPDHPRQNRLAVQTEPVRRLSPPEPSREDESKAQPLIPLEPPPGEAGLANSPPPGSSIVGSTERAETVPALPSENLARSIELYRKGDVAGGDRLREGLLDPVERRLTA